jgi:hypothetical protein
LYTLRTFGGQATISTYSYFPKIKRRFAGGVVVVVEEEEEDAWRLEGVIKDVEVVDVLEVKSFRRASPSDRSSSVSLRSELLSDGVTIAPPCWDNLLA